MRIFAQLTAPPVPKTKDTKHIALFYAGLLAIMAVTQLFTFESFLILVTTFDLPGGIQFAHFLTASLIVAEVFALPFLLRMQLSTAFRWVSMVCGWLVAIIWTTLTIWLVVQNNGVANVGFVGTIVDVVPGWWTIFMGIAFGLFATWASWGMWPGIGSAQRDLKAPR